METEKTYRLVEPMQFYEMSEAKYEFFKKCARLSTDEEKPMFTKEVYECEEHGLFTVIGIVGHEATKPVCHKCREKEMLIEASKIALLNDTLPKSGLFKSQTEKRLASFDKRVYEHFKMFFDSKEALFLLLDNANKDFNEASIAFAVELCRMGIQPHYTTHQELKYRVQDSWKGRPNTKELTQELSAFPYLIIADIPLSTDDWMQVFMANLMVTRTRLCRKTVLLGKGKIRDSLNSTEMFTGETTQVVEAKNEPQQGSWQRGW